MKRHSVLLGVMVLLCLGLSDGGIRARPGIEVLLADSAHLIRGRWLGLLTNQTGVDAAGVSTIDRLAHFRGARLVALFAPEHGIRGTLRPGESVADTTLGAGDTVDAATGLPIYSLYGPRRAPTAAQLQRLDELVVDLQDVGTRTFTFVSTVVYAMRAAKAAGKKIVVLDRPNPIGCAVQGPVLDTANASFIGMLPVPLRHGMTMGELARFANVELGIGADLAVVPVQDWRRCQWLDETGLPFVAPSPNLPTLESVAWYPGTVLFEATNLSVGRGTDAPFRQVGAPWLQVPIAHPPGGGARPAFDAIEFTPSSPGDGKYDGVLCRGRRFETLRREDQDPIAEALRLLASLRAANRDSLTVDPRAMAARLGVPWDPEQGDPEAGWRDGLAAFRRRVRPYLIYR